MANLSWISSNPDYINQMIRNTQVTLSNNYNDLDNIPIIKITSTTNNPQKVWGLKEGLYMIDGVVQVDNNTSYEVSNLLISMTARLENGKYILSAFIPYLRGLFEYILKTNSTEYEQHQKIVLMIKNDTLALDNETIYTPIEDYHPATKKYVDDKTNEIVAELDRMGVNKENLESLNKENRIRDIKLQALLSETSDRNITIEENVRYFDMPLSIDNGIVTINEIVGETLVNVCNQEESVAITKSYTIENENHIALQGEYDGSCRPVVYGNTLVNHNADWDGKVQTGVETSASGIEDVQVEGIKGQEVSVVVEGNTVLNHAVGKTSAVVSSIEDNLFNGNYQHGSLSSLLIKPLTTYTIIGTCLLNDATSENTGQFNYCFFSDEITHYNHNSLVYYTDVQAGEQFITTIVTDENCKYIGVYNIKSNFIMDDIMILEGDHTTNPKYVNFNEGNYVDLTVANDMSSVVEIEGRTMVNVCDQKDPIAITKSYTVENSGNHIALQGEYDGSCRPVIQGNTMVNLATSNSITLVNTHVYIPTAYKVSYGKQYTLIFNCSSPSDSIYIHESERYTELWYRNIQVGVNSYNVITFTIQYEETTDIRFGRATIGEAVTFSNIMLFEGDLTQTPELIPTEYVEGLKSSFEDQIIPQNLTSANTQLPFVIESNGSANSIATKRTIFTDTSITFKPNTTYTFCIKGVFESGDTFYVRTDSGNGSGVGVTINSISKSVFIITTNDAVGNLWLYFDAYVTGKYVLNSISVLEGDYSHLTEEDFNHLGKYKVEYKVTGKNKATLQEEGSYYSYNGFKIPNTTHNSYIALVESGKTYVVSFENVNRTEISNLCFWDYSMNFIKGLVFGSGNLTFTTPYNAKFITIAVNKLATAFQIEEGTQATSYEPYKEYTKTFYLNSPLLKGDTIEDVDGVATHVKRYKKVVFDGDENWLLLSNLSTETNLFFHQDNSTVGSYRTTCFSDKFTWYMTLDSEDKEGIRVNSAYQIKINKSKLSTPDVGGFKQWLSENPTTLVCQLASPIYEPISTESILCDSYVNGHLDFDSAVPIEKVVFRYWTKYLTYVKDNTAYTLQFESDNTGYVDWLSIGGTALHNISVTKGINKVLITTPTNNNRIVGIVGIGFNASNIVVTEAIDTDFDYFEGLKSSYECEVTEDGKYKVDVKVTSKNKFDKSNVVLGYWGTDSTTYHTNIPSVFSHKTPIKVKPNTWYTIQSLGVVGNVYVVGLHPFESICVVNNSKESFYTNNRTEVYIQINTENAENLSKFLDIIQLEEGTKATSYEPYFESTKTFYLNSPLLEGDKIVTKNGKVYHYHKMGKVVLDGSRTWWGSSNTNGITFMATTSLFNLGTSDRKILCDSLRVNQGINQDKFTDYNEILAHKSLAYSNACYISTQLSQSDFINWLKSNPITVAYELDTPYYELIDEYNNTILNIPKNVAHLTHTSAVPVNNTTFTNYKDELNVLEPNTQYRLMFDCDKANVPFTITLGGTSQEVISKKGTHSLLITTPSTLVDKNLVIDGIGRCVIDNIRIFKGNAEYDYVKGLWSGYEERKLENLYEYVSHMTQNTSISYSDNIFTITIGSGNYPSIRLQLLSPLNIKKQYTIIFEAKSTVPDKRIKWGGCKASTSSAWNVRQLPDLSNVKYLTTSYKQYCSIVSYRLDDGVNDNIGFGFFTQNNNQWLYEKIYIKNILILEGDWTDNPPTYEEVIANEGKYAVKVKLDTNATIFGKGGRL